MATENGEKKKSLCQLYGQHFRALVPFQSCRTAFKQATRHNFTTATAVGGRTASNKRPINNFFPKTSRFARLRGFTSFLSVCLCAGGGAEPDRTNVSSKTKT